MSRRKSTGPSKVRSCLVALIASVGLMSGAHADVGEREGEASTFAKQDAPVPLVAVELDNGNTVEFYEPTPGFLVVSELGVVPNEPLHTYYEVSKMTPVELYRALAPGADVPQILLDAQERALQAEELQAEEEMLGALFPDDDRPGLDAMAILDEPRPAQACSASWFSNRFCGSGEWQFCQLNRTGYGSFTRVDISSANTAVCPYRGTIDYLFLYRTPSTGWTHYGPFTVLEGYYRSVYWNPTRGNIESRVYNAGGDGYHHAGYGGRYP